MRKVPPPTAPLPDISIRQLEYLVAVADAPSWKVAAECVGVSGSALSQGLAELERRVGVRLFEPDGRRRVLRTGATPVLDHARRVVAATTDLVEWAESINSGSVGTVRVGMIDVAAVEHFPDTLREFRAEFPDVTLTLSVSPSKALLAELIAGSLDLVVCVEPPEAHLGVSVTPLFDEPLVVYGPPDTIVGDAKSWGPWMLFPAGSHTRQAVEEALIAHGAPVVVAAESHQPDVLREMVVLGLGWTVLPPSQGADDLAVGPELLTRRLVLARREDAIEDPAVDELARRLGSS